MPKLKLGPIRDDKPVKLSIDLSAEVHRDLVAYAELLARESGQTVDPAKLVAPMLARFMSGDRGFARLRRQRKSAVEANPTASPSPTTNH